MKLTRVSIAAFALLLSASALAQDITYDYGTVIESVPIVKNVRISTTREECWVEDVVYRESAPDNGLGSVVGAIVGGAIGNAVGHKKKNKQVGAVVGAVLGGTIGHSVSSRRRGMTVHGTEEVCKTYNDYHEEERVVGYRVRYRFNNETYTTRMDNDPGDTIRLRLAVSPVNS